MKKEINKNTNNNGSYKTVETNPDDGFVHEADIHNVNTDNYGKYFKGYSKSYTFIIDDPRITRPLTKYIFIVLLGIGIISLLLRSWFIGISFILIAILLFNRTNKDIDKIEQELKKSGNYKEELSEEEKQEYKQEVQEAFDDLRKNVFTEEHFNWLLKISIPICIIIGIIVFLVTTIFVNIIFGIFTLILIFLIEYIFYIALSKIFKY